MGVLFTHPGVEMGVLFRSGAIFNLSILDKIMFPFPSKGMGSLVWSWGAGFDTVPVGLKKMGLHMDANCLHVLYRL